VARGWDSLSVPPYFSMGARELLAELLEPRPALRMTAMEALADGWLDQGEEPQRVAAAVVELHRNKVGPDSPSLQMKVVDADGRLALDRDAAAEAEGHETVARADDACDDASSTADAALAVVVEAPKPSRTSSGTLQLTVDVDLARGGGGGGGGDGASGFGVRVEMGHPPVLCMDDDGK
jgi:hypothetical protein